MKKHSTQAPANILKGWAIEAFRRVLTRKAKSIDKVTDKWLKSQLPKLKTAFNEMAAEETHTDEPKLIDINIFLQDEAIQIRLAGETPDGVSFWSQHSFPVSEAVK